jgi:hypothetical protein
MFLLKHMNILAVQLLIQLHGETELLEDCLYTFLSKKMQLIGLFGLL